MTVSRNGKITHSQNDHGANGSALEQRDAQNISRGSERRYQRLFATAHDGIVLLDPDTGRILDANPFMTNLLGHSHDELLGKELWEVGLLRTPSEAARRGTSFVSPGSSAMRTCSSRARLTPMAST